jgi:hypothetical protein
MTQEHRDRVRRELSEVDPKSDFAHEQLRALRLARRALRDGTLDQAARHIEDAVAVREGRVAPIRRPLTAAELDELMDMRLVL